MLAVLQKDQAEVRGMGEPLRAVGKLLSGSWSERFTSLHRQVTVVSTSA